MTYLKHGLVRIVWGKTEIALSLTADAVRIFDPQGHLVEVEILSPVWQLRQAGVAAADIEDLCVPPTNTMVTVDHVAIKNTLIRVLIDERSDLIAVYCYERGSRPSDMWHDEERVFLLLDATSTIVGVDVQLPPKR